MYGNKEGYKKISGVDEKKKGKRGFFQYVTVHVTEWSASLYTQYP